MQEKLWEEKCVCDIEKHWHFEEELICMIEIKRLREMHFILTAPQVLV